MKREPDDVPEGESPGGAEFLDIVQVQRLLRPSFPYNAHAHNLHPPPGNIEDWFNLWFNNTVREGASGNLLLILQTRFRELLINILSHAICTQQICVCCASELSSSRDHSLPLARDGQTAPIFSVDNTLTVERFIVTNLPHLLGKDALIAR
ncbi:hypothetical protein J6590_066257 [Homalodisca vitripennis]|nr:hypothetical protein J6590_066257 [Homalodisca vitripennis]